MTVKVLAVDDSQTMRDLLSQALEEAGFDVHTAIDGEDGLKVLKDCAPDVIVTDINMPNLDGFGFIEAVRKDPNFDATPILTLTTESEPELKRRARDAGATGWIVKPFQKEKLAAVIRRVAT